MGFFKVVQHSVLLCLSSECGQYSEICKAIPAASHEIEQIITIQSVKLGILFLCAGRICSVHAKQS